MARQKDCHACPIKETCLPPGQKQRFFSVTIYHSVYSRARERNRTAQYQRERFRRRTIAEATFASLDRLGWDRSRLRGVHGDVGPQSEEDGTEIGGRCRTAWSSGPCRRDSRQRRERRGRCDGQSRRSVVALCLGKLVDVLPQARTTVGLLSVRRLSQRTLLSALYTFVAAKMMAARPRRASFAGCGCCLMATRIMNEAGRHYLTVGDGHSPTQSFRPPRPWPVERG